MTTQMQETIAAQDEALDLAGLVREINDEHHATVQAMRDGLAHARRAGELLLHVKAKLMHGAFMSWVERYCEFSHRTATMYMRIAREWDRIASNWQSVANFGIVEVDQWLTLGDEDAAQSTGDSAADEQVEADPFDALLSWVAGAIADLDAALVALRPRAVGRTDVSDSDVHDMLELVQQLRALHTKAQERRWVLLGRAPDRGLLRLMTAVDGRNT